MVRGRTTERPATRSKADENPVAATDAVVYSGGPVLVVDVLANDVEALTVDNLSITCAGAVTVTVSVGADLAARTP